MMIACLYLSMENEKFVIVDSFSLKSKDYLFQANYYAVAIKKDTLFLFDHSEVIKKINLVEKQISTLKYKHDFNNMIPTYAGNIEFVNDSIIVFAASSIRILPIMDTLTVGGLYSKNGELKVSFKVSINDLGYNEEFIQSTQSLEEYYVTHYNEKVYFSFVASKKVLVFDLNANLINNYALFVNTAFWQEPHMTTRGFYITPVTTFKLQIHNDKIYHLIRNEPNQSPSIVEYTLNFDNIIIYDIKDSKITGFRFNLLKTSDGFIVQDLREPIFYTLINK